MRLSVLWMFVLLMGCREKGDPVADLNAKTVTLPDGTKITAELKVDAKSQEVGMMYRDSLAQDRGMLFYNAGLAQRAFWMHNCKIPLDIVWLDATKKVVELAVNAQPCQKPEKECPTYGGHQMSQYVLELGGGEAKRHGVAIGQILPF